MLVVQLKFALSNGFVSIWRIRLVGVVVSGSRPETEPVQSEITGLFKFGRVYLNQ